MGLRALLPGIRQADLTAALGSPLPGPTLDLASPWAPRPNHLAPVVLSDIFGADALRNMPMGRAEAMAVPAVARARHIICGTVARIPLRAYRGNDALRGPFAPSWIESTSSALPPYHRALWTADDLLFHGWSCWSRTNSAADGFPVRMDRIPMGRWSIDDAGRVKVDRGDGVHELVSQSSVVLIPGPHEGLLVFAQSAIRHARDLQTAAGIAAATPAATLALKQIAGTPMKYESDDPNQPGINELLDMWANARKSKRGGVAYLPPGLEAQELGSFESHLLESGRNAANVDIARAASLPADLLDAAGESSLTYANSRDNDVRAIQYGVGLYLSALSAALSQDAVTPRGQSVRFDLEEWLESPGPGWGVHAPGVPAGFPRWSAGVTLPAAITYGQVKFRAVTPAVDSVDVDAYPDAVPVAGKVTFTPSPAVLLAGGATPTTVIGSSLVYNLDSAGVLRDSTNRDLVSLLATDAPSVSPVDWTWTARFRRLDGTEFRPAFSFALPAGSVVDLTTVSPVPQANGTAIVQGPPGLAAPFTVPPPSGGDDTASVVAAIEAARAAGGGRVMFSPGTYLLTAALPAYSRITYDMTGATLSYSGAGSMHGFYNAEGSTLAAPMTDTAWIGGLLLGTGVQGPSSKGFYIGYLLRPRWIGVEIRDWPATGFGCDFMVDYLFAHCRAVNCGRLGAVNGPGMSGFGIGTGAYPIENGIVFSCHAKGNKNFGIFLEQQPEQNNNQPYFSKGAKVIGCTVEGNNWGIGECGVLGAHITGNDVLANTSHGILINAGTASLGIPGQAGLIESNQIRDNGGTGILFDYTTKDTTAPSARYRVRGNHIHGSGTHGIAVSGNNAAVAGIVIDNNDISSSGSVGVRLARAGSATFTDLEIVRNRIRNSSAVATGQDAIYIGVPVTRGKIAGNRAWDDQGTKRQARGLQVTAVALSAVVFEDNDFRGNLTAAVTNAATMDTTVVLGANPGWTTGITGTPEGVLTAPVGTTALRADGGAGTTFYVKQSGTGNTGWVGK